jgi:hypothetical protein
MKTLLFILSVGGFNVNNLQDFTRSERMFIRNVIKITGDKPEEIYRLENNKIRLNYPDQRITLGQDGFIHELAILDKGEWIDLGPEY